MLSVIVPSYQRPDDLGQCLRSLRKNSSTECEVLVLSPELSARTRSICGRYQAVLIDDGSRSGGLRVKSLWSIINRGIDLSTNEFACWLNDDCTVNPGWDAKALSHFHAPVGLVVLRTKGINQSADYEIRGGYLGVPMANYAILRSTGVRFDENFSWFYGDADISLEMVKNTNWQVVGTTETDRSRPSARPSQGWQRDRCARPQGPRVLREQMALHEAFWRADRPDRQLSTGWNRTSKRTFSEAILRISTFCKARVE